MKFTSESAVVKTWVRLIKDEQYTRDQVPNLGNLQEVVFGILDTENERIGD
jgi:hypothetical protein